jgi:hypothetical protein
VARSLPDASRGELYVVLGFTLLCNPFVVGALDVGDPDSYRYEPQQVAFHENGTYDVSRAVRDIDTEVACLETLPSRSCMLERAVHANGGVVYDGLPASVLQYDYWYVYVWEEGFFEPAAEETGNGTVAYGLEPVAQSEALDDVAVSSDRASRGVRTALETGSVRTSDPLPDADELVAHDGSYYVVTATSYRTASGERRDVVVFLQWVLGIGGAWLVLRGQRLRVTATA